MYFEPKSLEVKVSENKLFVILFISKFNYIIVPLILFHSCIILVELKFYFNEC
jgi:hypothetical protein